MNKLIERRLAEFVDRDTELEKFRALLQTRDKPILVIFGDSGMGKTSLLLRMTHECALRKLRKAEVVWNDTSPHDYMAVMRKIRDDVGTDFFAPFTDLINFYTDAGYRPKLELTLKIQGPLSIEVGSNMKVEHATVGDISGISIRDNMFVIQRPDLPVPESTRRQMLTKSFIEGLHEAVRSGPIVVLLDTVEKMSTDTRAWLWEQLLNCVRTEEIDGVKFVLCGRTPPPDDRDWKIFVDCSELKPLRQEDITEYLTKRAASVSTETRSELAKMVYAWTKGRPTEVATAVDLYLTRIPTE